VGRAADFDPRPHSVRDSVGGLPALDALEEHGERLGAIPGHTTLKARAFGFFVVGSADAVAADLMRSPEQATNPGQKSGARTRASLARRRGSFERRASRGDLGPAGLRQLLDEDLDRRCERNRREGAEDA
jgi:hypothetical protein